MLTKFKVAFTFCLPYAPTINTYWRMVNNRMLISKRGRLYRKEVYSSLLRQGIRPIGDKNIFILLELFPPDKRKRDTDNLFKSVFDALEFSKFLNDDNQIKFCAAFQNKVIKNAQIKVYVFEPTEIFIANNIAEIFLSISQYLFTKSFL